MQRVEVAQPNWPAAVSIADDASVVEVDALLAPNRAIEKGLSSGLGAAEDAVLGALGAARAAAGRVARPFALS